VARIVGGNCQLHLETKESGGFKGRGPDADEIFQNAPLHSWLWLKHKVVGFSYAFFDWIMNPNQCLLAVV